MIAIDEIESRILGRSEGDVSCFWTRAGRAYRDGLARMTAVRPDATEADLGSYCDALLQLDRDDRSALWSLVGLDVRSCSNELQARCWQRLRDLGDFRPSWLVEHAFWVAVVSGKDTVPLVSRALRQHRLVDATRGALLLLRSSALPGASQWVDRVIAATS